MPSRRPFRSRWAILAAGAGVLTGVLMVAAVVAVSDSGEVEVRLGDDEFRAGRADSMLAAIERSGPILFPDLLGQDRPIYLAHTGPRATRGWLALDAIAPGQQPSCVLAWDMQAAVFVDPCSDAEHAVDSEALRRYPTRVDDRFVYVDLRAAADRR